MGPLNLFAAAGIDAGQVHDLCGADKRPLTR
jgi:hypothetical protein